MTLLSTFTGVFKIPLWLREMMKVTLFVLFKLVNLREAQLVGILLHLSGRPIEESYAEDSKVIRHALKKFIT